MASRKAIARRRAKAAELYKSGLTLEEVGKRLGVSHVTIHRDVTEMGLRMRPSGPKVEPGRRAEAARLYRDGLTLREVGERLGVTADIVLRDLKSLGIKRRRPGPASGERPEFKHRNDAMRAMRKDGATLREIGEVFGVSHQRVDQVLSRKEGER